jgi:hypothetical protein
MLVLSEHRWQLVFISALLWVSWWGVLGTLKILRLVFPAHYILQAVVLSSEKTFMFAEHVTLERSTKWYYWPHPIHVGFVVDIVTPRQVKNSIEFPKQSCRLLNFATIPSDIIIKRQVSELQLTTGWYQFTVSHYFTTAWHLINKIRN